MIQARRSCGTYEAADTGLLSPELAAGIRRVKGAKKVGVRLGNWLTAEQAKALLDAPNIERVRGRRDGAPISFRICLHSAPTGVIDVVTVITAIGDHMTTSITEETGTAQATATGEQPKPTKKALVGARRAHVTPRKTKSAALSFGRILGERWSTPIWWRSARIST